MVRVLVGAVANAVSAIFAHYPWFYTYKALSNSKFLQKLVGSNLLRNASIGFASSIVSDTLTNSIRVIKTTKQAIAVKHTVSYGEVVAMILAADGWKVSQIILVHVFINVSNYLNAVL